VQIFAQRLTLSIPLCPLLSHMSERRHAGNIFNLFGSALTLIFVIFVRDKTNCVGFDFVGRETRNADSLLFHLESGEGRRAILVSRLEAFITRASTLTSLVANLAMIL